MIQKEKIKITAFVAASLGIFLFSVLILVYSFYEDHRNRYLQLAQQQYQEQLKADTVDPYITKGPGYEPPVTEPGLGPDNPAQGSPDAANTIVVYSDYDCRYCLRQFGAIQDWLRQAKASARLVWKDYPDEDKNSNSFRAAAAARCARMQGKFWEYNLVLSESADTSQDNLKKIAADLGLDMPAWRKCLEQGKTNGLIEADMKEGNSLGISGVPYFFINGREFMGEVTAEELKQIIK